jgi:hypothetical protein
MINIGAEDYNVLKQQYIKKYIRLELLDFQYNIVDELSGNMTKCSINVDSNSDLRRSCDLGFVVTTSTFDIKAGSKLWLDKFVRPYVGYENMRTGEIQWYNQGIYLVNNPQWSYNASTNEISMQALDLMSKLTGLRNGNLEGIPTKIAKDENVREAIIKTIELGGFTKYICEECKTNDGTIVPVPYDIEIDVGGTIYDILTGLRDIMPNYQIYFDINGVFHYEPIPLAYDDPVLIDDDLFNNVLISENINTDFESVKNYVEVLGHTWDVDYYSPSESTTVSGGTITPTFADLKTLEDGTSVGITLPTNATSVQILPDGYTQLEYIQSNGGAHYIDTGFKPNQNTGIIAKFQLLSSTGNQTPIFSRTSRNVASFGVFLDSNSKWTADYGTLRYTNSSISAQTLISLNFNKNVVKFNNNSYTFDAQTFQGSSNLTIFGMNTGGTVQHTAKMKLYSCEIYDNGTLIRNFIPCKNSSGTIGLYDIVNSQFYTNVGTGGVFTAGPEVEKSTGITINYLGNNKVVDIDNVQLQELSKDTEWIFQFVPAPKLPSGYTELEYIQSSGTQYIDTGFKPNQDTRVVTKFDMIQTDTTWRKLWGSASGTYDLDFALWNDGTTKLQSYYGTKTNNTVPITSMSLNVDANKNIWKYSGKTITFDKNNFTCAYSMYVFNVNKDDHPEYLPGMMKLYLFKIYDNDVLVRDFIPCKNPSGTVGLYDSVNNQFYQNAGSGTFIAGPEIPSIEDKGGPFWRFMGHQQAQATSYDDNPSSPFYVGNPIGSSSVGRIRIVLYGGEYDNIYSDDLAQQRADFEIYQRSRLNDSISMETIPIPWMDANIVISHRFGQKQEPSKYIVKSFSVDYATGGTMTINAITWYPYYEESEVV